MKRSVALICLFVSPVMTAEQPMPLAAPGRFTIGRDHYAIVADLCKTAETWSLKWNGRTAALITGYDGAVIAIECRMLEGGRRLMMNDGSYRGYVNICEQNEAGARARDALRSEPGLFLPVGCDEGPRPVAEHRAQALSLQMTIACTQAREDADDRESCASMANESSYYEHVLGQTAARMLRNLPETSDTWAAATSPAGGHQRVWAKTIIKRDADVDPRALCNHDTQPVRRCSAHVRREENGTNTLVIDDQGRHDAICADVWLGTGQQPPRAEDGLINVIWLTSPIDSDGLQLPAGVEQAWEVSCDVYGLKESNR